MTPDVSASPAMKRRTGAESLYTASRMRRFVAVFQLWTVLLAVTVFAFPPELGCCAGLMRAHGTECCEAALTDPAARSCCDGENALAPVLTIQPALQTVQATPDSSLRTLLSAVLPDGREAGGLASLQDRGLYTLYRSLLI